MKSMPDNVNPFAALMLTYLVAAVKSAIIFILTVGFKDVGSELLNVNWTLVILALPVVGLEIGYVFVYPFGGNIITASVVANSGLACVLLIVGYVLYKENVSLHQIFGIIVSMFGLILINI